MMVPLNTPSRIKTNRSEVVAGRNLHI
jgi:hypothetical protein